MWPGPGRGVNGRVLGEMARRRPVSPCPAPRAQRCMQAGGVHSVLAMRAKARTSARRMPGFACDWSANARPRTEARACATHGRERAQLATRIADWSIQQRLSLHGQETGGGARSRLGRGGGEARPHALAIAPFQRPMHATAWASGLVCVCANYRLAVPISWQACRLVTPWPPRHSAVETRGCGASHMGARRPHIPHAWVKTGRLTHSSPPPAPSVRRSIGDETCTGGVRTDGTRNLYHSTSHDER